MAVIPPILLAVATAIAPTHTQQILSLPFNTFLLFPVALRPKTPDLSKVAHTLPRLGLASLFPSREHVVF